MHSHCLPKALAFAAAGQNLFPQDSEQHTAYLDIPGGFFFTIDLVVRRLWTQLRIDWRFGTVLRRPSQRGSHSLDVVWCCCCLRRTWWLLLHNRYCSFTLTCDVQPSTAPSLLKRHRTARLMAWNSVPYSSYQQSTNHPRNVRFLSTTLYIYIIFTLWHYFNL